MKNAIKSVAKTQFTQHAIIREDYLLKIEAWLSRPEIIIIKGIRRCGKSTILHQIAQRTKKKCVYVNFDDYRFLQHLDVSLLEEILNEYPDFDYYFFDEIQKIKGF